MSPGRAISDSSTRLVDGNEHPVHDSAVGSSRRVTANLPSDLIEAAQRVTGRNLTETLTEGLKLVKRSEVYAKARRLKGKIQLDVDLRSSRERGRR
jgi:hypothetical protein